jgi:hypothetical protein
MRNAVGAYSVLLSLHKHRIATRGLLAALFISLAVAALIFSTRTSASSNARKAAGATSATMAKLSKPAVVSYRSIWRAEVKRRFKAFANSGKA